MSDCSSSSREAHADEGHRAAGEGGVSATVFDDRAQAMRANDLVRGWVRPLRGPTGCYRLLTVADGGDRAVAGERHVVSSAAVRTLGGQDQLGLAAHSRTRIYAPRRGKPSR